MNDNNKPLNISYAEKISTLESKYKKQFDKYFKAMNYRIMSCEVHALYNVLVLKERSKDNFCYRWEGTVCEILKINLDSNN